MNKKILCILGLMLSAHVLADPSIKPVINGKVYNDLTVPTKTFGKPKRIIKGDPDECNGGFYPNELDYGTFKLLDTGLIREVTLNDKNSLIFHGQKVTIGMKKTDFLKKFKDKVWIDGDHKDMIDAQSAHDEYTSIRFYFKNGTLEKYNIWQNDC